MAKSCERCGKPLPAGRNKFHVECELEGLQEFVQELKDETVYCTSCKKKNVRKVGNTTFTHCGWCGHELPK